MAFINLMAFMFFLGGPIEGYHAVMGPAPTPRWRILAWSSGGGAAGAVLLAALLLGTELSSYHTMLPRVPMLAGEWALFGLLLGVIGIITGAHSRRRLLLIGLAMVVVIEIILLTIDPTSNYLLALLIWLVRLVYYNPLRVLLLFLLAVWQRSTVTRMMRRGYSVAMAN